MPENTLVARSNVSFTQGKINQPDIDDHNQTLLAFRCFKPHSIVLSSVRSVNDSKSLFTLPDSHVFRRQMIIVPELSLIQHCQHCPVYLPFFWFWNGKKGLCLSQTTTPHALNQGHIETCSRHIQLASSTDHRWLVLDVYGLSIDLRWSKQCMIDISNPSSCLKLAIISTLRIFPDLLSRHWSVNALYAGGRDTHHSKHWMQVVACSKSRASHSISVHTLFLSCCLQHAASSVIKMK